MQRFCLMRDPKAQGTVSMHGGHRVSQPWPPVQSSQPPLAPTVPTHGTECTAAQQHGRPPANTARGQAGGRIEVPLVTG